MAIQIRPTRNEVSRSFPVLGFTIRTGQQQSTYEVVLATDPALMRPAGKSARTRETFWSSRERGPLPAPRGEAVFLVPPDVLARFAGQERLYYGIAVFSDSEPNRPKLVLPPEAAAPYVVLSKSYDGRTRRLGTGARSSDAARYGTSAPAPLMWAGDLPAAGAVEPVSVVARAPVPAVAGAGSVGSPAAPTAAAGSSGPAAAAQEYYDDGTYDDGLSADFWKQLEAEVVDDDEYDAGPIPEVAGYDEGATVVASSLGAPVPEYPNASRFVPASTSNYTVASGRTVQRIVIHITDGSTIAGTITWFRKPNPKQVSAHYVIGQDGEVVQMVRHADIAHHARGANRDSIGIEHVANTQGLAPTQAEYEASARLVAWLCSQFGIPIDRQHILGHREASGSNTDHNCPSEVWDWEQYMGLVEAASAASANQPVDATQALLEPAMDMYVEPAINEGVDDCHLVPQPIGMSSWAAAATMVYAWTHNLMSYDPSGLEEECRRINGKVVGFHSLEQVDDLAQQLGLTPVQPQSYSLQRFRELLRNNGPLLVGLYTPKLLESHFVCVVGLFGDGTPEGTDVIYHDPWPPGVGESNAHKSFTRFMAEYEKAAPEYPMPVFPYIWHGNGRRSSALALGLGPAPAYSTGNGSSQAAGTATLARAAGAPAAVGIAIGEAAAGAAVTALLGNTGDVTWSLAQMTSPHYPGGDHSKAGEGPYRPTGPIQIRGPRGSTFAGGDEIYADFEVSWETNGRSIGSVTIAPAVGGVNDAAGAALDIRTMLTPMMTELPGPATNPSATMASVLVQFQYTFTYSWASTTTALIDVELHGDGTFRQSNRW